MSDSSCEVRRSVKSEDRNSDDIALRNVSSRPLASRTAKLDSSSEVVDG